MLGFWVGVAMAGNLVINGEPVEPSTVQGLQMAGVDVVVDAEGTVHILSLIHI